MCRKKIIAFILVSILAFSGLGATVLTESISINTSFSFTTSCFIGFSKVNVTDCGQLADHLKYQDGNVIYCHFNPDENAYISDVFYAYCQAFSKDNLWITIKVPKRMTEVDGTATIPCSIVSEGNWRSPAKVDHRTLTKKEVGAGGKIRVALSQPIQIRVESSDVDYGKSYSMDIELEVKVNA